MTTISEKRNYWELKEITRMMNSQGSDTENISLIEEGKKGELMKLLNAMKLSIKTLNLKYKTMSSYCFKCKENKESINPKVLKTNNVKTMILSKYAICGSEKSKSIEKQEASGIISNLGLKKPLKQISLLGDILFCMQFYQM